MSFSASAPFNGVVYITDTIGDEDLQASGVLIAPNLVLTAAHAVYQAGVG
jgi:V8-like Glu-specific endopeptidase